MASDNADWLALTEEEALEPDLPICDPHHHLWDARAGYVQPRYLLDEYLEDLATGHNVVAPCSSSAGRCSGRTGLRTCARSARPSS